MENQIMISMKDLVYLAVLLISVVSSYAFLRSDVKALAKDKLEVLEFEKKISDLKECYDRKISDIEKNNEKKISEIEMAKAETAKVDKMTEEFIGFKKDLETILEKIENLGISMKELNKKLEKHINEEKE